MEACHCQPMKGVAALSVQAPRQSRGHGADSVLTPRRWPSSADQPSAIAEVQRFLRPCGATHSLECIQ